MRFVVVEQECMRRRFCKTKGDDMFMVVMRVNPIERPSFGRGCMGVQVGGGRAADLLF